MFFDELERIERREKMYDEREERRLIPIDSFSQLDTGYTGRPDTDMERQDAREKELRDRKVALILRRKPIWFEEYRVCGCVSESVSRKKDLCGYCPTHGTDRSRIWREYSTPTPEAK